MVTDFLKGKYGFQLSTFLFLTLICWFASQLIALGLVFSFTSVSFSELGNNFAVSEWIQKPDGYKILAILLGTQSIGLFLIPGILFPRLTKNPVKNYFFLNSIPKVFRLLGLLLLIGLSGVVIVGFLGQLNMQLILPDYFHTMEESANETIRFLLSNREPLQILTTILLMAVLPAIGEELFFRGVIQQIFVKWTRKNWVAILITAFLFSAIHFQFLTFLPRFFMGIILGYLFVWSKNILFPILAHFLHNFVSIVFGLSSNVEEIGKEEPLPILLILASILIFSVAFYLFYSFSKKADVP